MTVVALLLLVVIGVGLWVAGLELASWPGPLVVLHLAAAACFAVAGWAARGL